MAGVTLRPDTLERMVRAVEKVRERLLRSTAALDRGGVSYAVVGGNAVAAWVYQKDRGAIRATQDVDILIRRSDLDATRQAMEAVGFEYVQVAGVDLFLDGPDGVPSEGVHLLFAGEKVKAEYPFPSPDVVQSEQGAEFKLVSLDGLVLMKLMSFRRKDQVHLQDMVRVGLIDSTWPDRYTDKLADRLREIIADPDG